MRKTELLAALSDDCRRLAFAQSDAQDPPSRVARLNYLSGAVSFRPGTVDEWTAATLNYPSTTGTICGPTAEPAAELHVGSTALRMDSQTALAVLNLDDRMVQLSLTGGTLEITLHSLARRRNPSKSILPTPPSRCCARATTASSSMATAT